MINQTDFELGVIIEDPIEVWWAGDIRDSIN